MIMMRRDGRNEEERREKESGDFTWILKSYYYFFVSFIGEMICICPEIQKFKKRSKSCLVSISFRFWISLF